MSVHRVLPGLAVASLLSLSLPVVGVAACPNLLILPAGIEDDFAFPPEATEPSARFANWAAMFWIGQTLDRRFDEDGSNAALLHTFTGWRGPVCAATLTLRLRAGSSALSTNDSVRLALRGGSDMQAAFHYWVTIRRVLGSWEPGAEGVVELDLGDLPAYGGFPTDILRWMSDGDLEILVEDDTRVDFARLAVCPCTHPLLPGTPVGPGPITAFEATTWGGLKARYATALD